MKDMRVELSDLCIGKYVKLTVQMTQPQFQCRVEASTSHMAVGWRKGREVEVGNYYNLDPDVVSCPD